jgi:hypothetical protein
MKKNQNSELLFDSLLLGAFVIVLKTLLPSKTIIKIETKTESKTLDDPDVSENDIQYFL